MNVRLLAFTDTGFALAVRLSEALGGEAFRCGAPLGLEEWTERAFSKAKALVFVGAAGIAVRAIAPFVKSKATDPAVVVVDELGRFAVPILSGHLGGANDLALKISELCGAVPVITTATDIHGLFAVDRWAVRQGCAVLNPEGIKAVSSKILAGGTVGVSSDWPVEGEAPAGVRTVNSDADVRLTVRRDGTNALVLVPRIAVLGVGCKRGTDAGSIEEAFQALLERSGLYTEAFCGVCSIDLKQNEPGLLEFCRSHGIELNSFSADELENVQGNFSASEFVKSVTGVDNVCERAAVLGSGGTLLVKKQAGNGVTMAAALKPFAPDWRWQDE